VLKVYPAVIVYNIYSFLSCQSVPQKAALSVKMLMLLKEKKEASGSSAFMPWIAAMY